jgi:ketosteroid isomerase-like protein
MMNALLISCLLLLPFNARAASAPPDLLQTDRDFAQAISQRGLEGWMSFMSENSVLSMWHYLQPVAGQAEIRKYMEMYFGIPGLVITLNPESAHLSPSGDAGYTSGTYEWVSPNAVCKCTNSFHGTYVTAWRLGPDGRWKVKSFTVLEESGTACGCETHLPESAPNSSDRRKLVDYANSHAALTIR